MDTLERTHASQRGPINPADSLETFDYSKAYSRNLGLVQPEEQRRLHKSVVAIAGLGGVGGVHLTTLARTGIGGFHIADFDSFEIQNFNRQAGATVSSVGRSKVDVMAEQLMDINPTARVQRFETGVQRENVDAFLDGVDVVVDGLDFFAVEAREMLYDEAERRGIPLVTAGPIGMSVAWLVFRPGSMSWRDYFAFHLARHKSDKYLLFALGLTPRATQMSYLDRNYVNLEEHRGPSMALAVQLCAGVAAAEILKILLGRGTVSAAPNFHQFDAYKGKLVEGKLRWGNRGWIQRLKARIYRWVLSKKEEKKNPSQPILRMEPIQPAVPYPATDRSQPTGAQITAIVDSARWAPSGDNIQPFSFEWNGKNLLVHEDINRSKAFMNVGNIASDMALGMCLANMELSAEQWGWVARWEKVNLGSTVARVSFGPGPLRPSPLAGAIRTRAVDRRPFREERMSQRFEKELMEHGENLWGIRLHLLTRPAQIQTAARIHSAFEAFMLGHRNLHAFFFRWLRWSDKKAGQTMDGLPLSTLGVNPLDAIGLRLLARWGVARLFKSLGLTRLAAARALRVYRRSAAFGAFIIPNTDPITYVRMGWIWQRLWLYLTKEGWTLQPVIGHSVMAHLCKKYQGEGLTSKEGERFLREDVEMRNLLAVPKEQTIACVFRLGRSLTPVTARAPRRPLAALLKFTAPS
ncbi:MAG: ThiF family adenylyltransferase [Elusimicrobia bacterium]|nr:ThiF family adenylyltransferase [Elusimicrobiota bacterium]